MYCVWYPNQGAFLKYSQTEAKTFGKSFGVVELEPRSSSLEHTWLTTRVWSIALMEMVDKIHLAEQEDCCF